MGSAEAEALALAQAWRERGGVAAAMAAIRCGPPGSALQAAKALGALVHDSGAQAELSAPGSVRAVLQVYTSDIVGPSDIAAFKFTLKAIVETCPTAPAQLIAACDDPDPWCAFAAIFFSQDLLGSPSTARRMLEAGVAEALGAALFHRSPYCRSAAAAIPDDLPHFVADAVREAGLVAVLMGVTLVNPPESRPLPPSSPHLIGGTADFPYPSGNEVTVPFKDPSLMACVTLTRLAGSFLWAAVEIFKSDGAELVMQGLRAANFQVATASAELMSALLLGPAQEETGLRPHVQVFCAQLAEGLPALLPSLLGPEQPQLAEPIVQALIMIVLRSGADIFPEESADIVQATLEGFFESDNFDAALGGKLWVRGLIALNGLRDVSRSWQLSPKLMQKLCGALNTGDWDAWTALLVLHRAIEEDESDASYEAAVSSGFVPGLVQMLRAVNVSTYLQGLEASCPCENNIKGADECNLDDESEQYRAALLETAKRMLEHNLLKILGHPAHVMQAVDAGLLTELRFLLSFGTEAARTVVLGVCESLLQTPEGTARLRSEGLMPSLLLELVHSPHGVLQFGEFLQQEMCHGTDSRHVRAMLGELEAAGVLAKVAQAFPNLGLADTCARLPRAAGSESLGSQAASLGAWNVFAIFLVFLLAIFAHIFRKGSRAPPPNKGLAAGTEVRTSPAHATAQSKGEQTPSEPGKSRLGTKRVKAKRLRSLAKQGTVLGQQASKGELQPEPGRTADDALFGEQASRRETSLEHGDTADDALFGQQASKGELLPEPGRTADDALFGQQASSGETPPEHGDMAGDGVLGQQANRGETPPEYGDAADDALFGQQASRGETPPKHGELADDAVLGQQASRGGTPPERGVTADDALFGEQARSIGSSGPYCGQQARSIGSSGPYCATCGKGDVDGVKLQLCAGCNAVFYCGRECQRRHWKSHRLYCAATRSRHGLQGAASQQGSRSRYQSQDEPSAQDTID